MIVLDTHAWVWWTHDPDRLTESQQAEIARNEGDSIGVSAMSCWEVAKLAEYRRLALPLALSDWFDAALTVSGPYPAAVDSRGRRRVGQPAGRLPPRPVRPDHRRHRQGARLSAGNVRRQNIPLPTRPHCRVARTQHRHSQCANHRPRRPPALAARRFAPKPDPPAGPRSCVLHSRPLRAPRLRSPAPAGPARTRAAPRTRRCCPSPGSRAPCPAVRPPRS